MKFNFRFIAFIVVSCVIILLIINGQYMNNQNEQSDNLDNIVEPDNIIEEVEEEVEEIEYINVWVMENADIKEKLSEDSKTIGTFYWNTETSVAYVDDNWAAIEGTEYYINRSYLSELPPAYVDCDVPEKNGIKSYMDYRTITSKNSNQYKLQASLAYTGEGGLRMVNGRYCVALGSYYTTTIGQYVDIELENGSVIQGILADCKADIHTDETNRMNSNGSVVEFVVDTKKLEDLPRRMGDISHMYDWKSKVVNIKVYEKVEIF